MKQILFLEGPAFSGKTTYLNQQREHSQCIAESSEFLGGDMNFPDAPVDAASMAYCSYFFTVMENARLQTATPSNDRVYADRFTPLSSLIFYSLRYANGMIETSEYEKGLRISRQIYHDFLQLPDALYGFVRFSLSSSRVLMQRLARGTRNQELMDWDATIHYEAQYKKLLPKDSMLVIDGKLQDTVMPEWLSATELKTLLGADAVESQNSDELDLLLPEKKRREIEQAVKELIDNRGRSHDNA